MTRRLGKIPASERAQPDPWKLRRILWWAQIVSVLILAALAWWLPDLTAIQPLSGAPSTLFLIGAASVPLIFIVASRLNAASEKTGTQSRPPVGRAADSRRTGPEQGRYILILALAELPAILGLVYVLLGGLSLQALMLAGGSFVLLFLFPPA